MIFSLVRPYLKNIAIVPDKLDGAIASTAFFVCRPGCGIDSRFLLNLLRQDSFIASIPVYGNSPPAARDKEFEMLRILVPPESEQSRIADILDELLSDLDAGVEALQRVKTKLKLYRAAVLKAAMEGRLTDEWRKQHPVTESGPELLERILGERRCRWEEEQLRRFTEKGTEPPRHWQARYSEASVPNISSLPELPISWCWATIDQVGEIQGGLQKTPHRAPATNHYPYLRVANVKRGQLNLNDLSRFELSKQELRQLALKRGDLLIVEGNGSRSEIGRCAMWQGEIENCVHQNHIIRVRPLPGSIPQYINLFLNSPTGQQEIQRVASSTSGLYTLSVSKIERLALPLPPIPEQQAIVDAAEEQASMIDHIETDIETKLTAARALRLSIFHRAFTGQLVPQDPNDEPAEEILKRIAAERAKRSSSTSRRRAKTA